MNGFDLAVPAPLFDAALVQAVLADPETSPAAPAPQIAAPAPYRQTEVMTMNKTTTNSYPFLSKNQIAARLAADEDFQVTCLGILYARQTAHEQATETTLNRNRRGFMSSHAVNGCRIAKKAAAGEELTPEDRAKIAEIVPRYTKQLAEHFRSEAVAANPALKAAGAIFGV